MAKNRKGKRGQRAHQLKPIRKYNPALPDPALGLNAKSRGARVLTALLAGRTINRMNLDSLGLMKNGSLHSDVSGLQNTKYVPIEREPSKQQAHLADYSMLPAEIAAFYHDRDKQRARQRAKTFNRHFKRVADSVERMLLTLTEYPIFTRQTFIDARLLRIRTLAAAALRARADKRKAQGGDK